MKEIGKTKVLFCITKGNFGGAQKYVFDLATNLPKERFETVVAAGTKDGASLKEKLGIKKVRVIDLQSSEREIGPKKDLQTFFDLLRIIKEENPDIVHLNSSKIGFLGALSVLYLKIFNFLFRNSYLVPRSIFTSHGWAFNEEKRSSLSKSVFYIAHYLTVILCDTTIAVSQKTKDDIAWLPFIKNKMVVVHNGINDFKSLTKKEASEIIGGTDGKKLLLTIAELHKNKGIDVALRGIAMLPEQYKSLIAYRVVGEGEERANLEKFSKELGLSQIVQFLGFIEDAKKILPGADIFMLPSRTENLPFAILEAGIKGLPIIAASVGGIPEIIQDMKNGILVHPQNPKEIAEAITYMLDHKAKSKEFGVAIKNTVTENFSLEKMLSKTIDLYNKLKFV